MLESFVADNFTYKKLTEAEQQKRGILGRLKGIIADTENSTRNKRHYSRQLWENVFNDDVIKEKISNHCLFGELGHPADREEVDPEKIAICLAEQPKINKDGSIVGIFDIVNTPCGKILKALCDYGCNIGVSSRGTGDLIPGNDDGDEVDPDSYNLECWDAVLVPAIKTARLTPVMESYKKEKTLKMVLNEQLEKASPDDRKIMEETIKSLELDDEKEPSEDDEESTGEGRLDIDSKEVVDDKSEDQKLVAELQEALKRVRILENDNLSLKNQLSVCNAKEKDLTEDVVRYKKATIVLSESAKETKTLKKDLETKDKLLESNQRRITSLRGKNKNLIENLKSAKSNVGIPEERFTEVSNKVDELTEALERTSKQLEASNKMLNDYRKSYKGLKEHYLELKVSSSGLQKENVLSKLTESYKIKDIDSVCAELSEEKRNLSKLPFALNESSTVRIKSTVKYPKDPEREFTQDDYISESLLRLANLNK